MRLMSIGTALTIADGVLTPAVSVTSAVGGIAVAKASVANNTTAISIVSSSTLPPLGDAPHSPFVLAFTDVRTLGLLGRSFRRAALRNPPAIPGLFSRRMYMAVAPRRHGHLQHHNPPRHLPRL